ncbi:MAG: hypothetical protein ACI82F_001778 [Planctomycetota bacterium]|jgi:hypothetical protein
MSKASRLAGTWVLFLIAGTLAVPHASAQAEDSEKAIELTEETRKLNAEHEAWRRSQEEYLKFREQGGGTALEEQEFAVYVAELQYRVFVRCEVVDELGGDANQYIPTLEQPPQEEAAKAADEEELPPAGEADPSRPDVQTPDAQPPGVPPAPLSMPIRKPLPKRKTTHDEKVAALEKKIEGVGKKFDESVALSKKRAEGTSAGQESSGGWDGGGTGGAQAGGVGSTAQAGAPATDAAGGDAVGGTEATGAPGSPPQTLEPGGGPGAPKENATKTERGPTADRSDDGVLARQLWEKAQNCEDEVLKAELMKKYNAHKGPKPQ